MKRSEFIKKYEKLTYLGDSVYARFDGYQIFLETHNGLLLDPSNVIALEPNVIESLLLFRKNIYEDAERNVRFNGLKMAV